MALPPTYGRHIAILVICSAPFCFSCTDFPIAWLKDIAETITVACVTMHWELGTPLVNTPIRTHDALHCWSPLRQPLNKNNTLASSIVDWSWKITFFWIQLFQRWNRSKHISSFLNFLCQSYNNLLQWFPKTTQLQHLQVLGYIPLKVQAYFKSLDHTCKIWYMWC